MTTADRWWKLHAVVRSWASAAVVQSVLVGYRAETEIIN